MDLFSYKSFKPILLGLKSCKVNYFLLDFEIFFCSGKCIIFPFFRYANNKEKIIPIIKFRKSELKIKINNLKKKIEHFLLLDKLALVRTIDLHLTYKLIIN